MTNVINAAHARGDRVVVTITMMAWDSSSASAQATLLGNATYRQTLIDNIISTVRTRNADGVNLDFEPVSTTLRSQYTSFVRQLKAALVSAGVGSYLTVCTMAGAATWATGYDIQALTAAGAADALFVMGYDYSGSWSSRAGGIAPMSSSYMLDVNESVSDYLSLSTGAKLIWGVPYYGEVWQTTSGALNASTVSGGYHGTFYYTGMKSKAALYGRQWDSLGQVPWFAYQDTSGNWMEGYYDDVQSLAAKYDMINQRGLAGVGIWHLQMDQGTSELWDLIANRFQADTVPPTGGIAVMPNVVDGYAYAVHWTAMDVGSGVKNYYVQVRDRASSTWGYWLLATTATSATFMGIPGHAYEFRVSARDALGNSQPWVPAYADPGSSLAVGGFATVAVGSLNVRSGAGTGFDTIDQLAAGDSVALLAGPISASGYQWYQIQFSFTEWPSSAYPRTGWVAAGDASASYIIPAQPPTSTTFAPQVAGYGVLTPTFSPNGDGVSDGAAVTYTLSGPASVQLEVRDAGGVLVKTVDLGSVAAGVHTANWDGRIGSGWAPAGRYLLTVVASDSDGTHVAPTRIADAATLGRWAASADLTAPTLTAVSPYGSTVPTTTSIGLTFSEPVVNVSEATVRLTDLTTQTAVAGSVSYDAASHSAVLAPAAALAAGHTFAVDVSSWIADLAGNRLAARSWTFSTAAASAGTTTTYVPSRSLYFSGGSHTGYQFDASGNVTAVKTYTLSRSSSAATSQRTTAIPGHSGAWFYVVDGVWAGYWLLESSQVYLIGIAVETDFASPHTVSFAAGTYTGYRFSASWGVSGTRPYTLGGSSSAAGSKVAVINGREYVYIINGVWADYWVPTGSGVTVH